MAAEVTDIGSAISTSGSLGTSSQVSQTLPSDVPVADPVAAQISANSADSSRQTMPSQYPPLVRAAARKRNRLRARSAYVRRSSRMKLRHFAG